MVTMSTIERPPAGLEYKTATLAAPAPAEPSTSADMWEGIVAVTGAPTGSGVGYAPGAIGRSLARRTPKVTHGRSWLRPVGVVEEAKELPPGHPCIPATLADGTPWPPTAGAVWAKLRFITGTGDGRTTLAAARRAGPAAWALGFQATKERKRAGLRVLDDLDLFQLWPRALVDDETGPGPEVKTAGAVFEVKAGGPPGARLSFRDRPGVPRVVSCSVCQKPAAALVGGGLRPGEALVCADCVGVMTSALDEHVATIDLADLDEAAELTTEQAYDQALDEEIDWAMQPDGSLVRANQDPARRGRAWSPGQRRAWGRS